MKNLGEITETQTQEIYRLGNEFQEAVKQVIGLPYLLGYTKILDNKISSSIQFGESE